MIAIKNGEGEIIGYEYEPTPYEIEIAECEEMDKRAQDPSYAARQEMESWYYKARQAFESQGIEVPSCFEKILAEEMRKKSLEIEKKEAIGEMEPAMKFVEALGYAVEPHYDYPTPVERGCAYFEAYKNGKSINDDEYKRILEIADENDMWCQVADYLHVW